MNVYLTSVCPAECARYIDDGGLSHALVDAAKLLSTALRCRGYEDKDVYYVKETTKWSYWAAETDMNYAWLMVYFESLCSRYEEVRGRKHGCDSMAHLFQMELWRMPEGELGSFPNEARTGKRDIDFSHIADVRWAYKAYLDSVWRRRKKAPTWAGQGRRWGFPVLAVESKMDKVLSADAYMNSLVEED